jgi:chitodextrinase
VAGICTDITPPASIAYLNVSSIANTSALLSWTNPVNADFSHVQINLNNITLANTSGTSYFITGLIPNSSYNVSIYTVDIYNNINVSSVSTTFTTLNATNSTVLPLNDTTPPASITGLYLASIGPTYFTFGWVNPTDSDFSHVIIYVNGANMLNTSANGFSLLSLNPDTNYEVTIYTVDTSGNINASGVSYSVTTLESQSNGGGSSTSSGGGVRSVVPQPQQNRNTVTPLSSSVDTSATGPITLQAPNKQKVLDPTLAIISAAVLLLVLLISVIIVSTVRTEKRPSNIKLNKDLILR